MKNYLKYFFIVSVVLVTNKAWSAESNDMGVCFVKVQKRTLQTLVNEIANTPAENSHIQAKMKYYNGLKSLFVFVDTYNYKLFWVNQPNKQWLETNCFQYGYITDLDFTRRAITRVYDEPSQPIDNLLKFQQTRLPAQEQQQAAPAPTPPPAPVVAPPPPPVQVVKPEEKNSEPPKYNTPNIIMHNYYNVPNGAENKNPQPQAQQNDKSPVNIINVGNEDKKKEEEKKESSNRSYVNYDVADYLSEPSYFIEANPFMAHEKVVVKGYGDKNEFNMFDYGIDLKIGYRFDQYFNAYVQGRYSQVDTRSIAGFSTVDQTETYDAYYGAGVEHVASRFLSLALEYNFMQIVSFDRLTPIDLVSVRDDQHTVNLVFKLNLIAQDEFKVGILEQFGMSIGSSTNEVMYDSRTKLYVIRSFEGGHFGANIGYERNRFKYESPDLTEVNRHRFAFSLNYGFDL